MHKVLVYRSSLLPLSETFIKDQVTSYRRWHGVLVGMRRLPNGLNLEELDVLPLRSTRRGLLDRIHWKVRQAMGMLPPHAYFKLRQQNASMLHVHFGPDALEAWPLAQALNVPMLVTLHGYDINTNREWWEAGRGWRGMRDYPARLVQLAQQPRVRFIAVSNAIRQRAIAYGIPNSKISVQYIGVDTKKFAPAGRPIAERGRGVLFVGRLVEKKGVRILIDAFARVQQKVPDASLTIAGDGPLLNPLQAQARQMNVDAQFCGPLSSCQVRQELVRARVFCLASVTAGNGDAEGLPIVLLEAQSSGVPVVTSARGGVGEAVRDGVTGFTFNEYDVDALTERLIRLLTDDAIAASMAYAGPRFASENFDLYRCTDALERLYDDVLARGRERAICEAGRHNDIDVRIPKAKPTALVARRHFR